MRRFCWTAIALLVCVGCGGPAVREPELSTAPAHAFIEVPYPPPAALVEIVPPAPSSDAVWVDGQWIWGGRYYVWQRGGWLVPPTNAKYALWRLQVQRDGVLRFAEGGWFDSGGRRMENPPIVRPAATPPGEETAEPASVP